MENVSAIYTAKLSKVELDLINAMRENEVSVYQLVEAAGAGADSVYDAADEKAKDIKYISRQFSDI